MRRETRETGIPRRRGYSTNGETRASLLRTGFVEVSPNYFERDRGCPAWIDPDGTVQRGM